MKTATVSPSDFDVLTYQARGSSATWLMVSYRGWIIEHTIYWRDTSGEFVSDELSRQSPLLGMTIRSSRIAKSAYKPNDFHALSYFFERETDLSTYLAGRLNLMKELTCDRHISRKLITRLIEAH